MRKSAIKAGTTEVRSSVRSRLGRVQVAGVLIIVHAPEARF